MYYVCLHMFTGGGHRECNHLHTDESHEQEPGMLEWKGEEKETGARRSVSDYLRIRFLTRRISSTLKIANFVHRACSKNQL